MNEAIIHGSASSKVESSYPDFILKKSASFGDFSANLMKSNLCNANLCCYSGRK
jgi:hypothetical protein